MSHALLQAPEVHIANAQLLQLIHGLQQVLGTCSPVPGSSAENARDVVFAKATHIVGATAIGRERSPVPSRAPSSLRPNAAVSSAA